MIVTLATLRAAGLTEAQIMRVVEAVDNERVAAKREQNRKASQKHRARQKNAADAADAADGHIDTSLLPSLEKKERKKGRKISIATDWKLSEEDRAYAREHHWSDQRIDHEGERFHNHYLANGETRMSWPACWRKWVTSAYQNGGQNGAGRQKGDRSHSISAAFDDIFAKLEGSDGASVVPFQANPRMLPNRRRE